jgi:hypothetical protein
MYVIAQTVTARRVIDTFSRRAYALLLYATFDSDSFARTFQIRRSNMLYTIAVILIVLWLIGLVSSYTMGGLIHILLVIALVVIVIQVIQGRRG